MTDHAERLDALEDRVGIVEGHIQRLDDDMSEIREKLGEVATKQDVLVVLRDALNAVPGKHAAIYTAALVVLTAIGILAPLLMHGR